MFEYYNAVIFIAVCSQLIMLGVIYFDILLHPISKKGFLLTFTALIIVSVSEWASVYVGNMENSNRILQSFFMYIVLLVIPVVPVFLSMSILEFKNKWMLYGLLMLNVLLLIRSAVDGSVFYISDENVFVYGELYPVYGLIYVVCFTQLFYNIYKFSKECQMANSYVLILIAILGISGNAIQVVFSEILIIWIDATIMAILTYIYFTAVNNQLDKLTHTFKRRCYENMLVNIDYDATIVLFDLNDFKSVNDKEGHLVGDYVLSTVGEIIRETYSKDGLSYRTGGDEFCVLLKRNGKFVEELNEDFLSKVEKARREDNRISKVALGYAHFKADENNILDIIEEADKMMYQDKNAAKINTKKED